MSTPRYSLTFYIEDVENLPNSFIVKQTLIHYIGLMANKQKFSLEKLCKHKVMLFLELPTRKRIPSNDQETNEKWYDEQAKALKESVLKIIELPDFIATLDILVKENPVNLSCMGYGWGKISYLYEAKNNG